MLETSIAALETVEDPRCAGKVEHRLLDVPVIAACAVLGEAGGFEGIALHGRREREWLGQFLALPNGIPSRDTFRRVLVLVDPDAFGRRLLARVRAALRPEEGAPRQAAVDGETVRRSLDLREGRSPSHPASAHATGHGLVLAQRAAGTEGGGLAAIPGLPDGLAPEGCLAGLDALACRPGLAERIVGRGGDHPLAREGERGKAHAEVKAGFAANALALGAPLRPRLDGFDDGHGRPVRRRAFACADLAPFATLQDWPGLAAVVAVGTIPGRGKAKAEIRHYLSSARLPAGRLAAAARRRRRVENGLHRVLDAASREDASRVRERNAAGNLARLRRIALDLARADTTLKAGLRGERECAGRDDAFAATLMAGRARASPPGSPQEGRMAEKRTRRRFTAELKAEAVRRLLEGGKGLGEVAAELGLGPGQLSAWRDEHLAAGSAEALVRQKAETAELQRLGRENRRLEEEVEILRKAAAFLARGIA
jgi:transposase-like protein/predicted transposase YbfD/YdcC